MLKIYLHSVPHGPINNIEQTFEHPQAVARGAVVEVDVRLFLTNIFTWIAHSILQHPRAGPIKMVAPAVSYNGKKMPVTRPPPWLGQHTDEVSAHFLDTYSRTCHLCFLVNLDMQPFLRYCYDLGY